MNLLNVYGVEDDEKWDDIVKSFLNHDVHYLSGYVKALQLSGEGMPLLFYYDDGITRAINVVFKRDISDDKRFNNALKKDTYFDFSSPYGYGGFIIEGDNFDAISRSYTEYCCKNSVICEFVRFSLFTDYYKKFNGQVETKTRNIVRKIDMNPEEMLMDFEHKVRKNLKKANNSELRIEIDKDGHSLDDFLEIYYSTLERNEANDNFYFKREFFEMLNTMKENVIYFNAISENKVISTEIVIFGPQNCYSYLGGTLKEYFHLRPNEFLKYEIIKWAYKKGLKNFVLGGGYSQDDGIFKYKKSFAPEGICDFYIGKKIFDDEIYNKLVNKRASDNSFDVGTGYFPKYRG